MAKSYFADMRERVIEAVVCGVSRHQAAELFGSAVSTGSQWVIYALATAISLLPARIFFWPSGSQVLR